MSYTAASPRALHLHSLDTVTGAFIAPQSSLINNTVAWPSANMAVYVPIVVATRSVIKRMWYANGSTATGNYDIGLYDAGGTRLLARGSTAKTTTEANIAWDCTDLAVGPGIYYLALACSNNTDTFATGVIPAAPNMTAYGLLTEASAIPLPATATFALNHALAFYPVLGLLVDTVAI